MTGSNASTEKTSHNAIATIAPKPTRKMQLAFWKVTDTALRSEAVKFTRSQYHQAKNAKRTAISKKITPPITLPAANKTMARAPNMTGPDKSDARTISLGIACKANSQIPAQMIPNPILPKASAKTAASSELGELMSKAWPW